jgi:hypothetical protein
MSLQSNERMLDIAIGGEDGLSHEALDDARFLLNVPWHEDLFVRSLFGREMKENEGVIHHALLRVPHVMPTDDMMHVLEALLFAPKLHLRPMAPAQHFHYSLTVQGATELGPKLDFDTIRVLDALELYTQLGACMRQYMTAEHITGEQCADLLTEKGLPRAKMYFKRPPTPTSGAGNVSSTTTDLSESLATLSLRAPGQSS